MTDLPPKLDYRALDPAERELMREARVRARSMGCWTTIGLALGLPAVGGLLLGAWLNRDYVGSMTCFLIGAIGIAAAGVGLAYESRRDFRAGPFFGGVALGVAVVVMVVAVLIALLLVGVLAA